MHINNVLASLPVRDLAVARVWYQKLFQRTPDFTPMPTLAEWRFPGGGSLQIYVGPERAGGGSCTFTISNIEKTIDDLKHLGIDPGKLIDGGKAKVVSAIFVRRKGRRAMPSAPEKLARVKDGWLQLAFLILRRDERELALLATIDLGPQDYFDRIVQLIKKREKRGFAIVYEKLQGIPGMHQGEEGSDEIQQLKQTAMAGLQQHGFTYLGDVVGPEDYWTKVPVDDGDSNSEATAVARNEFAQALRAIIADPEATVRALGTFPLRKELYDLFSPSQPDIARQRSARAAAAILEQAARYHVFALIGLDRVAGIIDAVAAEGYQMVQDQWMDVVLLRGADGG